MTLFSPDEALLDNLGSMVGRRPLGNRTAAHQLADFIIEQITAAKVPSGTRLFSEAQLRERTGLSRTVIREALRLLDSAGLIEVRPGVNGGVFVRETDYDVIRRSLDVLIHLGKITPQSLSEARREMESLCARLAAQHASPGDIQQLKDAAQHLHGSIGNSKEFVAESLRFHMLIAQATGNPIIDALMHSLSDIFYDANFAYMYTYEAREATVEAHKTILAAITSRDQERAWRLMSRHVGAFDKYLAETQQSEETR